MKLLSTPPRCLAAFALLSLGFAAPKAQAQVTLNFPGLYNHEPDTAVIDANDDPLGLALSTNSMWWLCLDVGLGDPWQAQMYNISQDFNILQSGVWENITDPGARAVIVQSITNMFFNNQALITGTAYDGGENYNNPIYAFQKASWILIHDYAVGYYDGTFEGEDFTTLYGNDSSISGTIVDDLLISSSIYNAAGVGQIFFGEAVDQSAGLQSVMLISVTPVPEPSAAVLVMLGAGFLAFKRRRR